MSDFDRFAFVEKFQHRSFAAHGIDLHGVEGGAGPLLLLLSGWPQSWYAWRKLMLPLAEHFHVVALEPPGLGSPPPASGAYAIGHIASHLDPVLDTLGGASALFLTHDIGAWIAYAYAARQPERVRRLVLIDAAIPGLAPPESYALTPERAHRTWHFAFNYLPDLSEMLIVGREGEFLTWLFRTKSVDWRRAFDADALEAYTRLYAADGAWSGGLGYYRAIFDSMAENKAAAATPLPMPVLGIGGDFGLGGLMRASLEGLAADLRTAIIADCGHYVPEEQPQQLLDIVLPFLREAAGGTR